MVLGKEQAYSPASQTCRSTEDHMSIYTHIAQSMVLPRLCEISATSELLGQPAQVFRVVLRVSHTFDSQTSPSPVGQAKCMVYRYFKGCVFIQTAKAWSCQNCHVLWFLPRAILSMFSAWWRKCLTFMSKAARHAAILTSLFVLSFVWSQRTKMLLFHRPSTALPVISCKMGTLFLLLNIQYQWTLTSAIPTVL